MASPPKESRKVVEGIFAINKPPLHSSAGLLRDLQTHFQPSSLFAPWLTSERRHLTLSKARARSIQNLKVKVGHGGTLDPMATGVLIVGVGKGTKCLQRFLECTKSYECVVLFGAATDSYDAVGKVVSKADYAHVTKELVEEKLAAFRGQIMQKPSVFSALKVDGKKMYEYAREGGEIPEVKARPVEVKELELVEWLEPGSHEFAWPAEEVGGEERVGAEKLLGVRKEDARGVKRGRSKSSERKEEESLISGEEGHPKKPKTEDEPAMSGALPAEESKGEEPTTNGAQPAQEEPSQEEATKEDQPEQQQQPGIPKPNPPAARLRMTVTSGFYVRSLCHDLGVACNSLGLMSSLIRTRQGDYELGKNVLEYSDLENPEVWEPKVKGYLEEFMEKEGWVAEEIEDEETWEAKKKEREGERREGDRERSWRGKGRGSGGGGWKGKKQWNNRR